MHAKLGDLIHYLREDRPHSAPVLTIVTVENAHDDWSSTKEQVRLFQPFGPSGRVYCTVHGMVEAKDVLEVVPAGERTLLNAAEQRQLVATERRVQALVDGRIHISDDALRNHPGDLTREVQDLARSMPHNHSRKERT